MSERLRLFVALDLPAAARSELEAWCARDAPDGVRCIPAQDLHLTLVFLGARSADDAAAVAALLPELARAHPVAPLVTAEELWLGRGPVLAVAIRASVELSALRAALAAAVGDALSLAPDSRAFTPHVTVGRVARGLRVPASPVGSPPALTVAAPALTLYRSRTDPAGARYEPLARVELGGAV